MRADARQQVPPGGQPKGRDPGPHTDRWPQEVCRVNPLKFDGSTDAATLTSWMHEIEKVFEWVNNSEERKVSIAQVFLVQEASEWWRVSRLDGKVVSRDGFRIIIEAEYYSRSVREAKVIECIFAQPHNVPVSQAIQIFNKILFMTLYGMKRIRLNTLTSAWNQRYENICPD